ncbi:MAG: PhoU domain-containing protein [Chitinivibrionales bacterium]
MNLEVEINYNITKGQVYSMAMLVQKALSKSLESLTGPDHALAHGIINDRAEIQDYETRVSDSSLMTLLLDKVPPHLINSVLSLREINHLLESIGRHIMRIAASATDLASGQINKEFEELTPMAGLCLKIFNGAVACYFDKNVLLPDEINIVIDKILELSAVILNKTVEKVTHGKIFFHAAIEIVNICKSIESVVELSRQIAEESQSSYDAKQIRSPRVRSFANRQSSLA